jgi:hypothetical protein
MNVYEVLEEAKNKGKRKRNGEWVFQTDIFFYRPVTPFKSARDVSPTNSTRSPTLMWVVSK